MAFYSSHYYEDDLNEYSRTPHNNPYCSAPFQDSVTYNSTHYEDDPVEYALTPYYNSYSSTPVQDSGEYDSTHCEDDPGEYALIPYYNSYSSTPVQDSLTYNSTYYEDDPGEYPVTSYYHSYSSSPFQDTVSYNYSYQSYENQIFSHYPPSYYTTHDPASSWSRISYSASAFSEPKYITLYEQSPDYYQAKTQFIMSYSVSDLNEPEFEEYDPTPYGGGYDIAATYGKPLSPSDETCYPRSSTVPMIPNSIPSPVLKEENPLAQIKPIDETPPAQIQPTGGDDSQAKPKDLSQGEDLNKGNADDGYGYEEGTRNGSSGENVSYDYGMPLVPQVPPGYGLEAMDICESLFGPWPCLTRNFRRACTGQDQEVYGYGPYGSYGNQWKGAADYLFGSSNPYSESGYKGAAIHAYQKQYYHEDPLHQQVEYVGNSWLGWVQEN